MTAFFGPAGNSESFARKGYRKNIQIPEYLSEFSLDAYEYQCGRGVRISQEAAAELGEAAKKGGIRLSLHAPYYISLSSTDPKKRENSIAYVIQSVEAAKAMGAERIVIHSGSCSSISRQEALALAKQTLQQAQKQLDALGLEQFHLCPETMGKVNQLGTLDEVMELCLVDDRFLPCIDFGHLNARTFGAMNTPQAFAAVLDTIENKLGSERLKQFHSHFSKIEYTQKGGEKRHLTFADEIYGPDYEPLMEQVAKRGLTPTFICESAGTQAEDAKTAREWYLGFLNGMGSVEGKDENR